MLEQHLHEDIFDALCRYAQPGRRFFLMVQKWLEYLRDLEPYARDRGIHLSFYTTNESGSLNDLLVALQCICIANQLN